MNRNAARAARRWVAVVATVAIAMGVGFAGGAAAVGAVPALLSPAGLQPEPGVESDPMPAPVYKKNGAGQTYGSALDATSPATEPDLISATTVDGRAGFVRKYELDEANGSNAAKSFTSPAQALEWQKTKGAQDRRINVYAADGVTIVGQFLIVGSLSQEQAAASTGSSR